jgi:hypothetical protein
MAVIARATSALPSCFAECGYLQMTAEGCSARPWAARKISRRSAAIASKQPAFIQRPACWLTALQGGRSLGRNLHCQPVRTIQRSALRSSRSGYSRWGASSFNQRQIKGGKLPFLIRNIARIRSAAGGFHAAKFTRSKVHDRL